MYNDKEIKNRLTIILLLILTSLYFDTSFSFMGLSLVGLIFLLIFALIYVAFGHLVVNGFAVSLIIMALLLNAILIFRYYVEPGVYYTFGADLKSWIYHFSFIVVSIVLASKFRFNIGALSNAFKIVIIFNLLIAMAQLFSYYLFDYVIDVSTIFGGNGNRTGKTGEVLFRVTGVYDEPSIYCGFIMTILCSINLIQRSSFRLDLSVLLSILFSQSIAGYVMILLFLMIKYFKSTLRFYPVMVPLLVLFFIGSGISERIGSVISGGDSSTNYKLEYINHWVGSVDYLLVGTGISSSLEKPGFFDAAYDLTFIPATLGTYGVLGLITIMATFLYLFRGLNAKEIAYIFVVSLKLTVLHNPGFIFIYTALVIKKYQRCCHLLK